jgi:hypothetical protein
VERPSLINIQIYIIYLFSAAVPLVDYDALAAGVAIPLIGCDGLGAGEAVP